MHHKVTVALGGIILPTLGDAEQYYGKELRFSMF